MLMSILKTFIVMFSCNHDVKRMPFKALKNSLIKYVKYSNDSFYEGSYITVFRYAYLLKKSQ